VLSRPKGRGIKPQALTRNKKIIDTNLAERLQDAKGMRNILSHRYGEIDNRTVFESIKKELLIDIKEFLEKTEDKYLKE